MEFEILLDAHVDCILDLVDGRGDVREVFERRAVALCLRHSKGSQAGAARRLGVSKRVMNYLVNGKQRKEGAQDG